MSDCESVHRQNISGMEKKEDKLEKEEVKGLRIQCSSVGPDQLRSTTAVRQARQALPSVCWGCLQAGECFATSAA